MRSTSKGSEESSNDETANILLLLLAVPVHEPLQAQNKKPTTLREVLLSELRSTHTKAESIVPA
jgi:hypothetical protein